MDTAQWPQEIVVKPLEEIVVTNTCAPKPATTSSLERKARPQKDQNLNCARCNSTNTKFCYYNNYSLTQPRYFCKTCRRYWTDGGSLRNIPVGGGSRKNKRPTSSSTPTSSTKNKLPELVTPQTQNPKKIHEGQDLNLAYPTTQGITSFSELIQVPTPTIDNKNNENNNQIPSSTNSASTSTSLSALELLTGISSRGLNSFMPIGVHQDPNTVYTSGFNINPFQEFKPNLNFSLDGLGIGSGGYGSLQGIQESTSGKLLFQFEDLKQVSSTTTTDVIEQNTREHGDSTGYWTGMLGGGSW